MASSHALHQLLNLHLIIIGCTLLFTIQAVVAITSQPAMAITANHGTNEEDDDNDSNNIIPTTPLVTFLERVQETALKTYGHNGFDPKLYVDMSLKKENLSLTIEAFEGLIGATNGSVSVEDMDRFIAEYLGGAEVGLVYVEPSDFVDEPRDFLGKVEHAKLRAWALEVHRLWKNLSRKVSDKVVDRPESFTLLPLKNPVVIPGSRFREVYYWDSYWVIRGLLASKMYETAKGIIYNLISLIDEYGHVLNGARAYYTNRSQPPLLSSMVVDLYNRRGDLDLIERSLPALLKEHRFWNSGMHKVVIKDAHGCCHSLSRYYAMWNQPRPESATTDKETASKLSKNGEKSKLYREIASTAESGWDFSSRWMRNESDLTTLATTNILPVDLNAFILKMEIDIAFLAHAVGDTTTGERFRQASVARKNAINSIFWNKEMKQWLDYWLTDSNASEEVHQWSASRQNRKSYASNFTPLWIELFHSDEKVVDQGVESLQGSGLVCAAGIATSSINSGQQWDFPNGWAPIQHMIVEGLGRSPSKGGRHVGEDIARRWIRTNYAAYYSNNDTHTMHEKYDVTKCGSFGGGGEYIPQTGFGWSNGVVLAFLEEFGWSKDVKIECSS